MENQKAMVENADFQGRQLSTPRSKDSHKTFFLSPIYTLCVHTEINDWFLTACQLVKGYFMPWGIGIAFIVYLYLHFC